MSENITTVQDLADQFAQLDAGEGWAFAAIVACGVEKGVGAIPKGVSTATPSDCGKVSAKKFSAMAGTTIDRIGRFLNAWDYAAARLCTALTPSARSPNWSVGPAPGHPVRRPPRPAAGQPIATV